MSESNNHKKNYSYVWISFIVLIFGILVVPKIIKRFTSESVVDNKRIVSKTNENAPLEKIGTMPKFSFTNQDGQVLTQDYYKGKVFVVEFFFVNCPTICPIMNKNMRVLDEHFYTYADFGIASFSIDEENDTPEVLKHHAEELGVQSPHWQFFTGNEDEIFAFANKFNLYAAANPNAPGGFEHSGMFALIDKNGKIRCRADEYGNPIVFYDGTEDAGIEMLKQDIEKLLKE